MALDPTEVVVGGTGRVWVGPVGTTEPADISVAVTGAWIDLGYTSEDGVEFKFSRDVVDIMGWQSRDPLRTVATENPVSVAFTLMQINKANWMFAMGGGTATTNAGKYLYEPPASNVIDERALIVEFADGSNDHRLIFRRVMNQGEVTFSTVREEAVQLPLDCRVLAPPVGVTHAWIMQTDNADFA